MVKLINLRHIQNLPKGFILWSSNPFTIFLNGKLYEVENSCLKNVISSENQLVSEQEESVIKAMFEELCPTKRGCYSTRTWVNPEFPISMDSIVCWNISSVQYGMNEIWGNAENLQEILKFQTFIINGFLIREFIEATKGKIDYSARFIVVVNESIYVMEDWGELEVLTKVCVSIECNLPTSLFLKFGHSICEFDKVVVRGNPRLSAQDVRRIRIAMNRSNEIGDYIVKVDSKFKTIIFDVGDLRGNHGSFLEDELLSLSDENLGLIGNTRILHEVEIQDSIIYMYQTSHSHPSHDWDRTDTIPPYNNGFGVDTKPDLASIKSKMEAIERYSIMKKPRGRALTISAFSDLKGNVISPLNVPYYSQNQIDKDGFPCRPFKKDEQDAWLRADSLCGEKTAWVQYDLIKFPQFDQNKYLRPVCISNSNGSACHISKEKAILSALFELIERHCFLTVWLRKLSPPKITFDLIKDLTVKHLITYLSERYNVDILDLTSELKVKVVLIVSTAKNKNSYPYFIASTAASNTYDSAMRKALYEQLLIMKFNKGLQPLTNELDECTQPHHHFQYYQSSNRKKFWKFLTEGPQISCLKDDLEYSDDKEILDFLTKRVKSKGKDVWVVDHKISEKKSYSFSAVSVISSAFQPLHFGLHLRRLENNALFNWKFHFENNSQVINSEPHFLS